jgi:hypothetical protein
LPHTFIAAEPRTTEIGPIVHWLEAQGFEATSFEHWANNIAGLVYFAIDTEFNPALTYAYLTLACTETQTEFTLDDYQVWYLAQLAEGDTLVARGEIDVGGREVKTITYEFLQNTAEVRDACSFRSDGVF